MWRRSEFAVADPRKRLTDLYGHLLSRVESEWKTHTARRIVVFENDPDRIVPLGVALRRPPNLNPNSVRERFGFTCAYGSTLRASTGRAHESVEAIGIAPLELRSTGQDSYGAASARLQCARAQAIRSRCRGPSPAYDGVGSSAVGQ